MDSLLAETLGDFCSADATNVDGQGTTSSSSATLPFKPPSDISSHKPKLPPRKPKHQNQASKPIKPDPSPSAMHSTSPPPPPFPPLHPLGSQMMESMPSDVKDLAEQLMILMQESGILDQQSTTDSSSSAPYNSQAGNGPSSAPPKPSGKPSEFKFKSPALASLAQQTKKTVESQSKYSVGESSSFPPSSAKTGNESSSSSADGMTSDMFGGLGSLLASLGSTPPPGDEQGGLGGAAGGGMNMMVDLILKNLLSKEVLYGPLVEIRDKYPLWISKQRALITTDESNDASHTSQVSSGPSSLPHVTLNELSRYEAQYQAIVALCNQYETDPGDFAKIMELIQGMQAYGDPPPEIVSDMTQGLPSMAMPPSSSSSSQGLKIDDEDRCPVQ